MNQLSTIVVHMSDLRKEIERLEQELFELRQRLIEKKAQVDAVKQQYYTEFLRKTGEKYKAELGK